MQVMSWRIQEMFPVNDTKNHMSCRNKHAVVMWLPKPTTMVYKAPVNSAKVLVGNITLRAMPRTPGVYRWFELIITERTDLLNSEQVMHTHCELDRLTYPDRGLWKKSKGTFYVMNRFPYDRRVRFQMVAAVAHMFTQYRMGFGVDGFCKNGIVDFIPLATLETRRFLCKGEDQEDWLSPEDRLLAELERSGKRLAREAASHVT